MAAKFKYCIQGGELVIKDLKAQGGATYYEGQLVAAAAVGAGDEGGVTVADGTQTAIVGVSNQGETLPISNALTVTSNDGATLTGTSALGTIENLKVIVNPDAVYGVDYDLSGTIATTANVDGQIDVTSGGTGYTDGANTAGYWLWDLTTGELNWVISTTENGGTTECEVVAGNGTAQNGRVLLMPSQTGFNHAVPMNVAGSGIGQTVDGDRQNIGVAGTDAINGIVLENRLESMTYGSEILDPVIHDKQIRFPNTLTSEADRTKAVAYVKFSSVFSG